MPLITHWYDERRTMIHNQFSGRWTYAELLENMDEFHAQMMPSDRPLVVLSEFAPGTILPRLNLAGFRRMLKHPVVRGKTIETFCVINLNITGRAILGTMTNLFPAFFKRVRFYNSLPEAVEAVSADLIQSQTL